MPSYVFFIPIPRLSDAQIAEECELLGAPTPVNILKEPSSEERCCVMRDTISGGMEVTAVLDAVAARARIAAWI